MLDFKELHVINTVFLLQEGEDQNEDTEFSEQRNQVDTEYHEDSTECTLVYDENFQVVCAEDLIATTENDDPVKVTIEESEEKEMYNYTVLDTIQQIKDIEEKQLMSTDTVELMEIYTDIQNTLDSIFDYLNLFIGLFFIGWIFSQLNAWRRNNKS